MRKTGVAVALGCGALVAMSILTISTHPLTVGVSAAWAQGSQGFGSSAPDRFFRVEAEGGQGRGGRPVVRGYIYNDYGVAAGRVLLQVETLDAGGQVVARSLVPADGNVPGFGRLYFEGPVSATGAKYRVSVYYYEWLNRGGGGS